LPFLVLETLLILRQQHSYTFLLLALLLFFSAKNLVAFDCVAAEIGDRAALPAGELQARHKAADALNVNNSMQVDLAVKLFASDLKFLLLSLLLRVPARGVISPLPCEATAEEGGEGCGKLLPISDSEGLAAVELVAHVFAPIFLLKVLRFPILAPLEIKSVQRAFFIAETLVTVQEGHQDAVKGDHLGRQARQNSEESRV